MVLRSILSGLRINQCSHNFWVRRIGTATLASERSSDSKGKSVDNRYVASYLVNLCGLSPEKATSISRWVHFDGPDKPNAVVNFLEKKGFTESQISNLVARVPAILIYDPEKTLLPKFESLHRATGVSETEITNFFSKTPDLLTRSFERRVIPVYNYVKGILGAEKVNDMLRKGSWIFSVDLENRLEPNVDLLREVGVPPNFIEFGILHCASTLFMEHVKFKRLVEEVKQMGFDPMKSTFIVAVKARSAGSCRKLWDLNLEVYGKWGWTEEDIRMAFKKHPGCMILSEKKISMALDFLVNTLGRESRSIARYPQIIFYSMEKRIVPRCSVVQVLLLEGLVEKDWCLTSVFSCSEEKFIDKYVAKYIEIVPQLNDVYLSKKASVVNA